MTGRALERRRGPALSNSALTAVLLLVVAGVALVAKPPAPPAIAEFAPQAQHQITQAPLQQTGNVGGAAGAPGGPGGTKAGAPPAHHAGPAAKPPAPAPAAAAPPPIYVPAVKHCYGNPPRQIGFDTQSPPCVAYWAGNNGGATARGVTGNEINVVVTANVSDQNNDATTKRVVSDLQDFFNENFEFYGRQLKLTWLDGNTIGSNSGNGPNCQFEYSAADGISQQYAPFAITDPNANAPGCFLIETARDHIVSVSEYPWFTEADMARYAPYLWQYPMGLDQELAATGQMMCADLVGKKPRTTLDPVLATGNRKFGIFVMNGFSAEPVNVAPLQQQLQKCGSGLAVTASAALLGGQGTQGDAQFEQDIQTGILQMQRAGVTTVVCMCVSVGDPLVTQAADNQNYHPEWIIGSWWENDWGWLVNKLWSPDQRQSAMGISFFPAPVPYPEMTLNQALESVDRGFEIDGPFLQTIQEQVIYWELLQIASGIQMAGPHLTAAAFQSGLRAARFPNPASVDQEGVVGFNAGNHGMTTDATVMWWDEAAPSPFPDGGTGTWCYVDGGRRFAGDWPPDLPFFQGACATDPPGS